MKGVEAPFQLLIAVFTMVMVATLAYFVLQHVQTQHCEDQWIKDVGMLALKIQNVAGAGPGTKEYTRIHLRCGDAGEHVFWIVFKTGKDSGDAVVCRHVCSHDPPCAYILHVVYSVRKPNEKIYAHPTCLEVSPYDLYKLMQSGNCGDPDYSNVGYYMGQGDPGRSGGWRVSGRPYVDLMVYRPNETDIRVCARK